MDRVAGELGEVDRRRRLRGRARLARLLLSFREVVDVDAEVVEAVAVRIRIRRFLGALPANNGDVEVAVGEVHLAREVAVAARELLQAERLLEQLRGRERIFRGDCDVTDLAHDYLVKDNKRSRSARDFCTSRPSRSTLRLRSQQDTGFHFWPSSPTSRETRITVCTRGLRRPA